MRQLSDGRNASVLQFIGAGVERTGTSSLTLAQLGLGTAHHMEQVIKHAPLDATA